MADETAPSGRATVIIVGGGPVGLIAALALSLADIDFILFEKRANIDLDVGASFVLSADSLRVLHQLDVLKKLEPLGKEITVIKSFTKANSKAFATSSFKYLRRNHGIGVVAFHRAELVQALHKRLSELLGKSTEQKVVFNRRVVDIESDESGVVVHCSDGNQTFRYEGSMVLGADGINSETRDIMLKYALEGDSETDRIAEQPFQSTYQCAWFSVPRPVPEGMILDELPGEGSHTQGKHNSLMSFAGRSRRWVFLYARIREGGGKINDVGEFVRRLSDYPVTEDLKVLDVVDSNMIATGKSCGMADLKEGILKRWYCRRIALVGDACKGYTPPAGQALQGGTQDVVALCNLLWKSKNRGGKDALNCGSVLTKVFRSYQEERWNAVQQESDVSAKMIRMLTWANWLYFIFSRYLINLGFIQYIVYNWVMSPSISSSLVLDYVPGTDPYQGERPWVHPIPQEK